MMKKGGKRNCANSLLTFAMFSLVVPSVGKHLFDIIVPMMVVKNMKNSPHASWMTILHLIIGMVDWQ